MRIIIIHRQKTKPKKRRALRVLRGKNKKTKGDKRKAGLGILVCYIFRRIAHESRFQ